MLRNIDVKNCPPCHNMNLCHYDSVCQRFHQSFWSAEVFLVNSRKFTQEMVSQSSYLFSVYLFLNGTFKIVYFRKKEKKKQMRNLNGLYSKFNSRNRENVSLANERTWVTANKLNWFSALLQHRSLTCLTAKSSLSIAFRTFKLQR